MPKATACFIGCALLTPTCIVPSTSALVSMEIMHFTRRHSLHLSLMSSGIRESENHTFLARFSESLRNQRIKHSLDVSLAALYSLSLLSSTPLHSNTLQCTPLHLSPLSSTALLSLSFSLLCSLSISSLYLLCSNIQLTTNSSHFESLSEQLVATKH